MCLRGLVQAWSKIGAQLGWFRIVQGMKEDKYLVRNRILVGRGEPAMIEGGYLTLQKDFGLGLWTGERTHFRTLSKRSRSRIEEIADRRNGSVLKEARKEITKLENKADDGNRSAQSTGRKNRSTWQSSWGTSTARS